MQCGFEFLCTLGQLCDPLMLARDLF